MKNTIWSRPCYNADPMGLPNLIGSYVSDYTGTWFEICEDQPNFYIGEYTKRNPRGSGHMGQRHHLPWYG